MPRPVRPWFRFYVEAFPDRKLRRLTPAQRWVFVAACGAARESPVAGRLLFPDQEPMSVDDLADYAGEKPRATAKAVEAMQQLGLLEVDGDVMVVPKFLRRQFESDNVTGRVAKHRTKERSNEAGSNVPTVVPSNVPHTEGSKESNLRNASGSPSVPAGFAARIVTAYVEAARNAAMPCPEEAQSKVERSAKSLLAQGFDEDAILDAAKNAAVGGWSDLSTQMQRDAARANPTAATESTTNQRVQGALELADRLERKALA